jgi:cytochrome P450
MHPSKYHKLQLEIDKIQLPHNKDNPSISSAAFNACQVSELPYLDAVINEVLRLKPASPSGQPRETPPEGLQIDEVRVPGNVIITVPQHSIQRDERNFADANEFRPERWINEDSEVHREAAFFPFCIGGLSLISAARPIIPDVNRSLVVSW